MNITYFDVFCLTAICDDYKTIDQVESEVSKRTHIKTPIEQLRTRMYDLINAGMATLFEFHATKCEYVQIDVTAGNHSEKFFRATDRGRKIVIANSVN